MRAGSTPQRMVLRALIVLMAADGTTNATIAEELGICLDTSRNWRARFCGNGIKGTRRHAPFGTATGVFDGRRGPGQGLAV